MARLIVLDSSVLSLAARPRGEPEADACRLWAAGLLAAGDRVAVPEVADYEVRRGLIKGGATAGGGLGRLDALASIYQYLPIDTATMRRAAELWAHVRNAGLPTAHPRALDADAVLAAQATMAAGPGDAVIVATENRAHIGRFPGIDAAEPWRSIA